MDEHDNEGYRLKISRLFVVATLLLSAHGTSGQQITGLSPSGGSFAGETRITITGSGLSKDQFSQNDDPNTGNSVVLASATREYPCTVHKDGTTEVQIMCYTVDGMPEDDYYVRVKVDGVVVPDSSLCNGNPTSSSCKYKPSSSYTPTITEFTPQSGFPGEFVTMKGKLVTDRYGSNIATSSNGKTEKLLRVYVGPQDCGLKENDTFYGLSLNSATSDDGTMMCKTKGTSVGYFNGSFIVEAPYGRSQVKSDLYRVSYTDDIFMYQIYTDITSISPAVGSQAGGLKLTIYGNYFDNRAPYTAPRAYVGDSVCDITNVVLDQYIECTVAADPQYSSSTLRGNRGVTFEYWTSTTKSMTNVADVLNMNSSDAGYVSGFLDEMWHTDSTMDSYVSRMTTYYSPPHDGTYMFMLEANDGARLYVDGTDVASSTGSYGYSAKMTLARSQRYLLKVVHFDSSGESFVKVGTKFFDTKFTASMTGMADQEKQTISVTSTVVKEVQELTFTDFGTQTKVNEVQTVTITSVADQFRFGLYGVYTEPLDFDMAEDVITTAFNKLPCFSSSEDISVTREQTATPTYVFTFDSTRGDFPDITVVSVGVNASARAAGYSVTETTKGTPDKNTAVLMMEGVVSPPFSIDTLTANGLETAIDAMFGGQCPTVFSEPSLTKSFESFESSGSYTGTRVKDAEAFCGRYSLKNPWRIFEISSDESGVSLSQYKEVCFAYRGILNNRVWLYYSYIDSSSSEKITTWGGYSHDFKKDSDEESTTWYYTCIDMLALVSGSRPGDSDLRVEAVRITRALGDMYVDAVFIGRGPTTTDLDEINRRRLMPSRPNRALIDTATVTKAGDQYTVTISPFECADQLPLIELATGQVTAGRVASPSTSATFGVTNGGGSNLRNVRTSAASPPVTGAIDVTFNGNTKSALNISLDADEVKKELMSIPNIGDLSVLKVGTCASFDLQVTFVTLSGDLTAMSIVDSGLRGIDAAAAIATNTDGGLSYLPLTGDMTSTVHNNPQVRLYINDVPVKCTGDCSFNWDASATPTVTAVTPPQGTSALSTVVTITGTGFDATPSSNTVTIGGVACGVSASTATEITCSVGNGPVGAHKVEVNVAGKGIAKHSGGDVMFTYTAAISSISPVSGSLGGGNVLTLTGYGFKSDAVVTMGGNNCSLQSSTPAEIQCQVPAHSAGQVNVVVTQGSTTLTHTGYTYDASLTPTVNTVSPSSIGVQGGTVTITGSNFGSSGQVFIGTEEATVTSFTSSQIVIEVGAAEAGTQELKILVTGGLALDGSGAMPTLSVQLGVTNITPLVGSLHGGTKLTVTGTGFGTNSSLVEVKVGPHACDLASVDNTKIECQIADTSAVHAVTNGGTDPAFGVYYAYDRPHITIEVGDFVQWSWQTPEFVNNVAHAIMQVDSRSATKAMTGGFSSGTPTKNGQFRYRFTQTGTFYVWSGFVDVYQIKNYAGTIEVVSKASNLQDVSVKVNGKAAVYTSTGSSPPADTSTCKSVTAGKSGCSDAAPAGTDASKFQFGFWTCSTPVVNFISPRSGTTQTTVTITGDGFSTQNCQNEISVGQGHSCTPVSSSEMSISCNVNGASQPDVGILHDVSLRVGNRGNALLNIMNPTDRTYGLTANIGSISPSYSSMAGGAAITITGNGFGSGTAVTIGGISCPVTSSSYSQVVCETPAANLEGDKNVVATVVANGSPQPATCETLTKSCIFTYATAFTPTISTVTPDVVSGPTTLQITGTKLGSDSSLLSVTVGGVPASVTSASDTSVSVSVQNAPAGNNDVVVKVTGYGKASGSVAVSGTALISSVTPTSGSIYGATLITIAGNGFVDGQTTVTLDGSACTIQSISLSQITCLSPAHADGAVNLVVTSNSVAYTAETFTYSTAGSPTVTSISPTQGLQGQTLTITGTNFGTVVSSVLLDGVACTGISSTATQITCTLGAHATGATPVLVNIEGKGDSNSDVQFQYQLSATGITPVTGGTAGGQTVTVAGVGFDTTTTVTVCGTACVFVDTTTTAYICKTPAKAAQACDVVVTTNGLTQTLAGAYTYNAALTPSITSVSPARGGTGGGVPLTVQGTGFGTNAADVSVTIAGSVCTVTAATGTSLTCDTGARSGSIQTTVDVEVSGNGIAKESAPGTSAFHYVDVWSSPFTWGGASPPAVDEFVVIPAGQTLILDTDTPVLAFLLIQGGTLIFDAKNIELQANYIMITDGGALQVGTEAEPFQHKAIITLHGHHRSKELPIYGTKVLAVRNGTLDLHGTVVPITWTKLATTATKGSSTLTLLDPVEWNVDDEIVIAATGHHHTQSENEKKKITAISPDKMTLTLDSPLEAQHLGTSETFDNTEVQFRAEIGLLTHNVVVRGNRDPQWDTEIKACPRGFNTGEFATQTCFLGRFGDEVGSSQFGGIILVHSPVMDDHSAMARISYVEVTFAGQAFRLGRYPIHFHLNGDMSTSYVRGCGIHETFNRAVNIHGTHNTLVEQTVIYNIMGGAFFLEDGIETGNTLQYNLAVFVRESSSLLNDDITPASFWVTNPNNIVRHNAAAGGSHFGYWYRMHNHPDGPSFTTSVCPKNVPLGEFFNNTAHSFGWFGLWIFEDYFPLAGGCGGASVQPAVFRGLTAWNNDKGAESVNSGALQFTDFVLVQNKKAGYEGKKILNVPQYTDDGHMIKDSLIVGTTTVAPDPTQGCTTGGIVLAYGSGFQVKNVRFVNFAASCSAFTFTRIAGTCSDQCGGYSYHIYNVNFFNAPNKANYAWDWEGILIDKDGSLTGSAVDSTVIPTSGTVPSDCVAGAAFSIGAAASICPPKYKWHRFAFKDISPKSLEYKNFLITNSFGTSSVPYRDKRISHKPGWMMDLVDGETYDFVFENADHMTNISFNGAFYDFDPTDYLFVKLAVTKFPDRFTTSGGSSYVNASTTIDPATAYDGDWEWDNAANKMKIIVHGTKRSKRAMPTYAVDRSWTFSSFKCYYKDCIPPPDPDTVAPLAGRPNVFDVWQDTSLWNYTDGYVTNSLGSYGLPQDFDDVRILFDTWVLVNTSTAQFGTLLLEGVIEFVDIPGANYEISAANIIIMGGRMIVGWPDDPFDGLATIVLRGNHSSTEFRTAGSGPTIGTKVIASFGGLDLHGKDVGLVWTKLSATAAVGANQITLRDSVAWSVDDEIVIGPTSYNVWETETFRITAVTNGGQTLSLNDTLRYRHVVHTETLSNGKVIDLAAPVGLLTRNIKIVGEDYDKLYDDSFGARVLVGLFAKKDQTHTGYARLSNVEFYHTGQEGYTESYDARFSLAYIATGTVSNVKPSSVTKCAFHHGFNSAVGAFGIGGLNITNNVVHHTVGNSIITSSDDTVVTDNLVVLLVWTGAYQNRQESFNLRWEAGIEAIDAVRLVMKNNLVTGSERFGYHVAPLLCTDTTNNYENNEAYSNLIGTGIYPGDSLTGDCQLITGFTVWKSWYYGIYYNNAQSFKAKNNTVIENTLGIFPMVVGPSATGHVIGTKTIEVSDIVFVGATSSFDCSNDVAPANDDNFAFSSQANPGRPTGDGMMGITLPQFTQGSNAAPKKPFAGVKTYSSIAGHMILKDSTFAHYTGACKGDVAVVTNSKNDDAQHPLDVQGLQLDDVSTDNKIFMHRPNLGKINSADCVDMDCDALKKALVKDLDGSLLGAIGSAFSQSEFEWDGDSRRGLGDYRIPKEMLTDLDGNRLDINVVAPNKGIFRNGNCTYMSAWQAWHCKEDLNYEMLMIESMDSDTETRRLSPVAILGEKYIDLINGPQDHGWCSGYTCRKRLSLFNALVATGKHYDLFFTSTTPFHTRYILLNSDNTKAVTMGVWYSRPNRLDVYVNGQLVLASNARIDNLGQYIVSMPKGNEYMPTFDNATGTNFIDRDAGILYFLVKGSAPVEIITQEVIIVSFGFPAMTVDTFFGENMVENLAAFLNIPLTKVRIVSVTSAAGNSGRRRRSGSGVNVEVEIGNEPAQDTNSTASNSLDVNQLLTVASDIVSECQVGNVSQTLNVTGGCNSVEVPSVSASEQKIVYSTPTPDRLFFSTAAAPSYEGVLFTTQPKVQAMDVSNVVVSELGTNEYPWQMTVSVRSGTGHSDAVLGGTLSVNASNGWFNFTDLTISHMGSGYILDYNITYPPAAVNFTLASAPFDIQGRPLKAYPVSKTSGNIVKDSRFTITLDLRDSNTNEIISDVGWRNHTWTATASIIGTPKYGSLTGIMTATFNPTSGQAVFADLNLSGFGIFYIQFNIVSSPAGFDFTLNEKMNILAPQHVGLTIEETYEIKVKYDVDYNTVISSDDLKAEFEQMVLQEQSNLFPDIVLQSGSISPGSILVTFVIAGSYSNVNSTAYTMCESILNSTSYAFNGMTLSLSPYMIVNNQTFYGVSCGSIDEETTTSNPETLHPGIIALIAIIAFLVIAALVALAIWKCNVKPKTQTHTTPGTLYVGHTNAKVEELMFREASFTSMKFNSGTPLPPKATYLDGASPFPRSYSSHSKFKTPRVNSPLVTSLSPDPIYVAKKGSKRSISPAPSYSSQLSGPRSHSPFEGRQSPMPPVGDLYEGEYIRTPIPRENTITLPEDVANNSPPPDYRQ